MGTEYYLLKVLEITIWCTVLHKDELLIKNDNGKMVTLKGFYDPNFTVRDITQLVNGSRKFKCRSLHPTCMLFQHYFPPHPPPHPVTPEEK